MDIRKLSGVNFNAKRLASSLKYTGLRDQAGSIAKVVKESAGAFKSGKFNSANAFSKIRAREKDLSLEQQGDIRQVLQHLQKNASEAAAERASALNSPLKKSGKISEKISDLEYRDKRAAFLRAQRAYEQTKNLGTGASAKKIQAERYSEVQAAEKKLDENNNSGAKNKIKTGLAGAGNMTGNINGNGLSKESSETGDNPFKLTV